MLLGLVERLHEAKSKHCCTIGINLDISKTFDTIRHEILLKELYKSGVRGFMHQWFKNYLTDSSVTSQGDSR